MEWIRHLRTKNIKDSQLWRKRHLENYEILKKAKSNVMQYGHVTLDAYELFRTARDEARLSLADEIAQYTEELFKVVSESYCAHYELNKSENLSVQNKQELSHKAVLAANNLLKEDLSKKYRPYTVIK